MKNIVKFIEINNQNYFDLPSSGEKENEHNLTAKKKWLNAGALAIKDIAISVNGQAVNIFKSRGGYLDRGRVTGFVSNSNKTKWVYISIADSTNEILYREANNQNDYTGLRNNFSRICRGGFEEIINFINN